MQIMTKSAHILKVNLETSIDKHYNSESCQISDNAIASRQSRAVIRVNSDPDPPEQGRREMALELVAAGVPLTLEDYKGHSPLYWAMKHIDFEFFR